MPCSILTVNRTLMHVNDRFAQGQKISHDVASGVIQMTVDHFTRANEGTYTIQINDGKAKTQSSLVLVGDGETDFRSTFLK